MDKIQIQSDSNGYQIHVNDDPVNGTFEYGLSRVRNGISRWICDFRQVIIV
jgi:hypothetical protein